MNKTEFDKEVYKNSYANTVFYGIWALVAFGVSFVSWWIGLVIAIPWAIITILGVIEGIFVVAIGLFLTVSKKPQRSLIKLEKLTHIKSLKQ